MKAEANLCGIELSLSFVPEPLQDKSSTRPDGRSGGQESNPVRDTKKDEEKR